MKLNVTRYCLICSLIYQSCRGAVCYVDLAVSQTKKFKNSVRTQYDGGIWNRSFISTVKSSVHNNCHGNGAFRKFARLSWYFAAPSFPQSEIKNDRWLLRQFWNFFGVVRTENIWWNLCFQILPALCKRQRKFKLPSVYFGKTARKTIILQLKNTSYCEQRSWYCTSSSCLSNCIATTWKHSLIEQ